MKDLFKEAQRLVKIDLGAAGLISVDDVLGYSEGASKSVTMVKYKETNGSNSHVIVNMKSVEFGDKMQRAIDQRNQIAVAMASQPAQDASWKPFAPKSKPPHNPKLRR